MSLLLSSSLVVGGTLLLRPRITKRTDKPKTEQYGKDDNVSQKKSGMSSDADVPIESVLLSVIAICATAAYYFRAQPHGKSE